MATADSPPESVPTLCHIPISHYSEKARWALDFKGIEHRRIAPPPGLHMLVALGMTRGGTNTFPVLRLDGRNIGDSTEIIAALEARDGENPLYPDDPELLRRALRLEEFFDERLGPQIRLLAWHELRRDPQRLGELTGAMLPGPLGGLPLLRGASERLASGYVQLRFGVGNPDAAEQARAAVLGALDRLETELEAGGGEYLVDGRFGVADLTAAALFYPLVNPPEGPQAVEGVPEPLERFIEPLRERPGYRWIERMFARHRRRRN